MKKIGIGAGILLVFLMAGALIVPGFVDWNKYKSQIEMTASDLSGRDVTINGDISLSILPSPSFSAEDVSVSNVEDGEAKNIISLKSVDVNVAFFPLLRSDIQVKKFILVEPIIAIEVDADGRGNWEFGSSTDADNTSSSTTELSFEQFQIENGQISYQNLATNQQELLRTINASVTMDSLQGPFEVQGNARYKNLPVSTEVMLGVMREGRKVPVNISAGLLDGEVQLKFSGAVLMDETSPQVEGSVNVDAGDIGDLFLALSLLDPENTNQAKKVYNQPLSLESKVAYGGDAIKISELAFEMGESRGSGNLTTTFSDFYRFNGSLAVNSFNLDSILPVLNKTDETSNNEMNLGFLETIEGNFNFKLGALQFNEKIASQLDLDLTASGGQLEITKAQINMPGGSELSLDGSIFSQNNKPEFIGNTTLNSGNFRAFLEWLKIDVSNIPTGRLTRLAYKGVLKADPELIQIYGVDGSLDTFKFKGGVSYALQERPAFGVDLSIDNLNIDNYLPTASEEPSDYKQSVALLGDFDANYKIKLANLTSQGIAIKNIDLNGNLINGNLNADVIKVVDYAGFNLDGSLTGQALNTNPQFDASFKTAASSLVALQRAYRFKTPYDIKQLGAISLNADIKGNFEKIDIVVKSTFGESKADISGEIRSATLKQLPEIGSVDLNVAAANPSFINLIDQFDLPFENILASDDKPFSLNTSFKSNQKLLDVDGTIGVAGGEVSLKGRANLINTDAPSIDMAVVLAGGEVREFIRGLGVDFNPAKNNLGPLNVKMAMLGTTDNFALNDISGNIGPTKLSGTGSITGISFEETVVGKPNLDFNLVLDNIPVHDFMEAEGDVSAEENWGAWNKEPMELALLNDFDGKAVISANNIIYNKYNFNNPRFEAVLKNGVINVSNFTGKLFGGDVAIAGSFSSVGDLDMDMSLKNAAIVEATTSVAGIDPITGYFDMTKKFTGKGTSQDALISSLSGVGQVRATPGIIKGINIPELSERLKGLNNKNGLLGLLASTLSGGQTQYQGGASSITTKNGFIQLSPLDVQMEGAQSAVNLGINLASWKMNLDGDMSLVDHPDAPSIGISALGDLHEPDIKYNTKQLEGFIAAKIASNLLQNMVEGNGGLGILFGASSPMGAEATPQQAPINPLERLLNPQAAEQVTAPPEEPVAEEAPAPVRKQETVEELGTKLLNRLFKTPPQ